MPIARPWSNTYWLLEDRLLCGEYPSALEPDLARERLSSLERIGIRTFVDLTRPHEPLEPYTPSAPGAVRHRLGVPDMGIPTPGHMRTILDTIDAALAEERRVYVHCWGGIGRTGTVAGCWLVRHGASGDEALATIARHWQTVEKRSRHPESPQTEAQRRFVLEWREAR